MHAVLSQATSPRDKLWITLAILLGIEALYGYLLEFSLWVFMYRVWIAVMLNTLRLAPHKTLAKRAILSNLPPFLFHLLLTPGDPSSALFLSFIGPPSPPSRLSLLSLDILNMALHFAFAVVVVHPQLAGSSLPSPVHSLFNAESSDDDHPEHPLPHPHDSAHNSITAVP